MAIAKARKSSTAGVARKPDVRIPDGVARKPDVLLEEKVRKPDSRSPVGKSDSDQVNAKKGYTNSAQATREWKVDAENTIARHVYRLRRSVRRGNHWYSYYYTQQEVADALCISRQAVVEIERGRRKLSAVELLLLAKFFKVDVTELLP